MSQSDKEIIQDILKEANLSRPSKVYRYTSTKYTTQDESGKMFLKANPEAQEMIIDRYVDYGHVFMAKDIGSGLSFLTKPLDEYKNDDRICVSTTIEELLSNGGKIYKVTSLPAYISAFFFTIPSGQVRIEEV